MDVKKKIEDAARTFEQYDYGNKQEEQEDAYKEGAHFGYALASEENVTLKRLYHDICHEWNETCDSDCSSFGHTETCKMINLGNAKRALQSENARLREALDYIANASWKDHPEISEAIDGKYLDDLFSQKAREALKGGE